MEGKKVSGKVKRKTSKENLFRSTLKKYIIFYNKNMRKKHIICFLISMIIFAFALSTLLNNVDIAKEITGRVNNIGRFSNVFKEKIPLTFLVTFSGITPFVYVPIIGLIGYPYNLATHMINMPVINLIFVSIGVIIQLFAMTLAVSAGIYYCTMSTKKFRYNQHNSFGIDDVKKQIYEIRKQDKKLEEFNKKREEKRLKIELLNVKIEYKNIFISFIISSLIIIILTLITGV